MREVGRNRQDSGAGFGGKEGDGEVWLVLRRDVEGLDVWVCIFVNREDGAAGAAFGEFIVECWIVYQFVVLKRLSPDRFDISVFGFGKGDDVGV